MNHLVKKNTTEENRYIRDLARVGSLAKVERGEARILRVEDYPEPIQRFLARERNVVRVKLSTPMKRKMELLSRATGIPPDELARRWIAQKLRKAS